MACSLLETEIAQRKFTESQLTSKLSSVTTERDQLSKTLDEAYAEKDALSKSLAKVSFEKEQLQLATDKELFSKSQLVENLRQVRNYCETVALFMPIISRVSCVSKR
jgi:septal ring factor EnvC (AmiA/AmiB activator)